MRIALCEDHEPDLMRLRQSIERFLQAQALNATVSAFVRPADYLAYMARAGAPEISFLDIYMGDVTGVEVAKKIRAANERAVIIFVTSSLDHMADGFEVGAAHYLVKPFRDEQVDQAMQRALMIVGEPEGTLYFPHEHHQEHIAFSEILYIEVRDRHCHIFTTFCREFVVTMPLAALAQQLNDPRFLDCHRSFIVNMDHIRSLDRDDFVMRGGQMVPIRSRPRTETLKQYQEYRFKRIRRI